MVDIDLMIADILSSKKYRDLNLPEDTIRDLLSIELERQHSSKDAIKAVRQKLHNIVAPYLGDPDYPAATQALVDAFAANDSTAVNNYCQNLLESHASTRERIPHMAEFFHQIWQVTGLPQTVLDLACGLNPFSLRWMGLPPDVSYMAYDIHQPRINLIQRYFDMEGVHGKAIVQDILVNPPQQKADAALFFKEAHRFDQRLRGCNRDFWQALDVEWLVVSLPASDLAGHHSLVEQHRQLVFHNLRQLDWPVIEHQVGNELIFCVHKKLTP